MACQDGEWENRGVGERERDTERGGGGGTPRLEGTPFRSCTTVKTAMIYCLLVYLPFHSAGEGR